MVHVCVCVLLSLCATSSTATAGLIIIDGTDANEHGSVSGGVNINGWKYMQKALENIATSPGTTFNMRVVADLGTSAGTARSAIDSAFNLSSLPSMGWTLLHVDGDAAITAYLTSVSFSGNTGILYIPTYGNAGGDLTTAEMAAINARASSIDSFVDSGGGLFAMAESGSGAWGWLTTLVPGLVATDVGSGGVSSNITLTAAGSAAFPGLTNADLAGADPWHGHFSGSLGGLSVLGTSPQSGVTRNVILGGGSGTTFTPTPSTVPEPGTLTLAGLGILLTSGAASRRKLWLARS
jgi:hypothetical protein